MVYTQGKQLCINQKQTAYKSYPFQRFPDKTSVQYPL